MRHLLSTRGMPSLVGEANTVANDGSNFVRLYGSPAKIEDAAWSQPQKTLNIICNQV